jgi:hypothetical protein
LIKYLYVKQHKETGLKYFGMTRKDPYKYKGSGRRWASHLKEHGTEVETISVWSFEDEVECFEFAVKFSLDNNIVDSREWANLVIEDSLQGGQNHGQTQQRTKDAARRTAESHKALNRHLTRFHKSIISDTHKGKVLSDETKQKLRKHNLGKTWSEERKAKYSKTRKGGTLTRQHYVCTVCGKTGKGPNMKRYHFENCNV